ncbi:TetR family transcriptional regulator C-terminal domain-containing protein [Gaetbulibacter saemankumensis]|uniref:TetR family transcriptional regulator C-terminal domain-containing protein n=1 Tax=Gaetbulibacter saemankumensis TaxID=311208 RepID=UPI0003F542FC|nr:TetR family transcriptional regulator C-terminal domain-containing protein [Gaetbulibacter saemankumensis]
MTNRTAVNKNDIMALYMEYLLNHGSKPKSVFSFTKLNNFKDSEFYRYFGSFKSLEISIYESFFENTLALLEKNKDYTKFNPRNKLLSFYYTFFEILSANRSYILVSLTNETLNLKDLNVLSGLKKHFKDYIQSLNIHILELKHKELDQIQEKSLTESAWIQLLFTLKFWLNDNSPSFEKTDIFIEKSVNATFDILDVTPLKSLVDLGKFLFKEKISSL